MISVRVSLPVNGIALVPQHSCHQLLKPGPSQHLSLSASSARATHLGGLEGLSRTRASHASLSSSVDILQRCKRRAASQGTKGGGAKGSTEARQEEMRVVRVGA